MTNDSTATDVNGHQDSRLVILVALVVLGLTVIKLIVAATSPLAFDEALYWRYSKHLAAGFIDHPYLNPLMIRIGTSIFGDTPLGVRFMAIVSSIPATWAVWRAGMALFADGKLAAMGALFFNLTIVMSVGSMVATSDEMVVTTSAILLFFAAKLNETGQRRWWIAIGVAFGFGMCAKYTTIFFAFSLFAWLLLSPGPRKWLFSPWPWASGLIALAIFSPVLLWNANHRWESFVYQSGRLTNYVWTLTYVLELFGALILLSTPLIFCLGVTGMAELTRRKVDRSAAILILSMIAPMGLYFVWLSTHERVQGNWTEPMFPSFSIAAAFAACRVEHGTSFFALWSRWIARLAAPVALLFAAASYLEAPTGFIPLGRHDVRNRVLGVGWPKLAAQIAVLKDQTKADVILTSDYTLNSWGKFYLPANFPVEQFDERVRWINEPTPISILPHSAALYICGHTCWKFPRLQKRFASSTLLATLTRYNKTEPINQYKVYLLKSPIAPIFDPSTAIPRADHDN